VLSVAGVAAVVKRYVSSVDRLMQSKLHFSLLTKGLDLESLQDVHEPETIVHRLTIYTYLVLLCVHMSVRLQ